VSVMVAVAGDEIWLKREPRTGIETRWDVLSSSGVPKATVRLPTSARLIHVRDGLLWTVEMDELDVPYVKRYRIVQE